MSNNPLVSVLMPAFNCEKFIAEAIKSVLDSSYSNFELIIVDDNSSDETFSIALKFQSMDNRIKVYRNEKNLGDYYNRNKAASYAHGKYLKYLDADDLIYPYGLEIFVTSMELYPHAALGVSQRVQEDRIPYPFLLSSKESFTREFLGKGVLNLGPTGTILRTDVFRELGGFSGKRHVGDFEFWLKVASQHSILKIQPDLIFWRRHEFQEHNKGRIKHLILDYDVKIKALSNEICPLNKYEISIGKKWIKFRQARAIVHLMLKEFNPKAFMVIKETRLGLQYILFAFLPWSIYKKIIPA